MFIIDEFEYKDDDGNPTGKAQKSQVGIRWALFSQKIRDEWLLFFFSRLVEEAHTQL